MESLTTLSTVTTSTTTYGIGVYKCGRICFVSFENASITSSYAAGATIVTLAAQYRPIYHLSFADPISSHRITIDRNGNISCSHAIASGDRIRGYATFITSS